MRAYGMLAAMAALSVAGIGITSGLAHEKTPRARRAARKPTDPETIKAIVFKQEEAKKRKQANLEAAELKRHRKAEKLAKVAAKGAIGVVEKKPEVLTVPTKHSSVVMGGKKADKPTKPPVVGGIKPKRAAPRKKKDEPVTISG